MEIGLTQFVPESLEIFLVSLEHLNIDKNPTTISLIILEFEYAIIKPLLEMVRELPSPRTY
jgi:hypothetical protein